MRAVTLSGVVLVGLLGVSGLGCGHAPADSGPAGPVAVAPSELRSQRRLAYLIARPVPIAATPGASAMAAALDDAIRGAVRHDMGELGLDVDGDPKQPHDLIVRLSASVQEVGRLARGRALMSIVADGRVIEQIDSAEVIEPSDRLGGALARDLVEKLARSARAAEFADAIYGRRLRPLRDSVGGHAMGREEQGAGAPPIEALAMGRRTYDRTRQGKPELSSPISDPTARAAAQAESARGKALLATGSYRDAYGAFEQAYLLDQDVEPLFGMAESLFGAGDRQDALLFYRAYLRTAPTGSSSARANAQLGSLEPAPRP